METDNVFLVVCGTLALVLLINAGILVALLRNNSSHQIKTIGKAIETIRDPLGKGNQDLEELRKRITKLEDQTSEETTYDRG